MLHRPRRRSDAAADRPIGVAGDGRGAGALLADVLADAAPRLRIRTAATLRPHPRPY